MPRSLFVLALLAAGLALARYAPGGPSWAALGLAGVAAAAGGAARGWVCRGVLGAAVVLWGYGYFTLRIVERGPEAQWRGIVQVEGVVLDTPRVGKVEQGPMSPFAVERERMSFDLKVTGLMEDRRLHPASGRIWVRVSGDLRKTPHAGDRVRVTGMIEPLEGPLNPGERDRQMWGAQDGRVGWLRVTSGELIVPAESRSVLERLESAWLGVRAALSHRAHEVLLGGPRASAAEPAEARGTAEARDLEGRALLGALILGDEDRALRDVRTSFNRLGLAHVLSISGFHLTVMCGVVLVLLRLGGDLGRLEAVIASTLILMYLAILPFNAPVWRSGLMVLGLIAADGLGRRHDRLAVLGWIAVVILLYRPMEAWSIGFQLSFGMVALLVWLGEFAHGRMFGITLRGVVPDARAGWLAWLTESMARLVSTSVLCGVVATPIVAYHTGLVSPAAVITSVLLIPPIMGLLIAGYLVLLLGVVAPPLAGVASEMLGVLSGWMTAVVRWIDSVPGTSVQVPRISLGLAVAATVVLLYWFVRGRWRDWIGWVMAVVVVGWTIAEFRLSAALPGSTLVRVDTLAVGDGTCHLVRSGREAMLWDCGSLTPGAGAMLVPRAVRELGVLAVPTVLVTHPNLDHFNGILDAAGPLGIRVLITGEAVAARAKEKPGSGEAYLFAELAKRGVEVKIVSAGDRIELGDVWLEVISPAPGSVWSTDNDASLVARVVPRGGADDAETAVLLCGDIQGGAIETIQRDHPTLRAKVVEAPHHGSAKESAVQFVMGLGPKVVMQSTGKQRAGAAEWGPVREQSAFYCTALDGASWVEVKRDGGVRSGAVRRAPASGR